MGVQYTWEHIIHSKIQSLVLLNLCTGLYCDFFNKKLFFLILQWPCIYNSVQDFAQTKNETSISHLNLYFRLSFTFYFDLQPVYTMRFYFKKRVFLSLFFQSSPEDMLIGSTGRKGEGKTRHTHRETPMCERETSIGAGSNHSLGMCLDQGLNRQLFDVWDDAPTSWATWPQYKALLF